MYTLDESLYIFFAVAAVAVFNLIVFLCWTVGNTQSLITCHLIRAFAPQLNSGKMWCGNDLERTSFVDIK